MLLVILVGLFALIIPIILLILFIRYLAKDIELFESKIRQIYCYIVMLSTLFGSIFAIIALISNVSELLFPEYSFNQNDVNRYLSNTISSVGAVIVCLPVFFYHRNIIEKTPKK